MTVFAASGDNDSGDGGDTPANVDLPSSSPDRRAERRIEFRVGIHLGDVVEESDGDLMGDGVNVAARLEGICEPGGSAMFLRLCGPRSAT